MNNPPDEPGRIIGLHVRQPHQHRNETRSGLRWPEGHQGRGSKLGPWDIAYVDLCSTYKGLRISWDDHECTRIVMYLYLILE